MPGARIRRILFPIHLLDECPALAMADPLVMGAVMCVLLAFWKSNCVDLPSEESHIALLARCNSGRWARMRGTVLTALEYLAPRLAAFHQESKDIHAARRYITSKAGYESARKRYKSAEEREAAQRPSALASMLGDIRRGNPAPVMPKPVDPYTKPHNRNHPATREKHESHMLKDSTKSLLSDRKKVET